MKDKLLILFVCLASFLASCDAWLEINLEDEISSEHAFSKGSGYRSVLNGIFQECGKEDLYWKALSSGVLSADSQTYVTISTNDEMLYYSRFAYNENSDAIGLYEGWWTGMYNLIANLNNLLVNIETADSKIFEYEELEKNLIKGEALALRAFLHLDIVRLFAPSPAVNKNFKMIPYQDTFPSRFTMPQTTDSLLTCITDDLLKAMPLVAAWDTTEGGIKFTQPVRVIR